MTSPVPPRITVSLGLSSQLTDQPVRIYLWGLPPEKRVTLRAEMRDDAGRRWRSWADFDVNRAVNGAGILSVASATPIAGSYSGIDGMGWLWSMEPDPGDGPPATFARTSTDPLVVTFSVAVDGREVAAATHTRLGMAPGSRRVEVRERGLVGTLFLPPGEGPHHGVIVLGGSSGGAREPLAALLAAEGFAALALAYFSAEGLPPKLANIPLEYFETALDWMATQDTVEGERCALIGFSRGAELALLLGATFARVAAVVAYAPSSVLWGAVGESSPAWTYHGEPLPVAPDRVPSELDAELSAHEPLSVAPWYRYNLEDEAALAPAVIPVERIMGPVLLISGEDDQMWPSTLMAERIMRRLAAHNFQWPYHHFSYPDAGHLIGPPGFPTTVNIRRHPTVGVTFAYGGTARGMAYADRASWAETRLFLRHTLRSDD